jgi:phosphatidylinositol alpha 1,6-mannosyltransferase
MPPLRSAPPSPRPAQGDGAALPLRVALFTGNYNHIPDGVSRTLNRVVAFLERQHVPALVFGPTIDEPPMAHAGELVTVPSVAAPGRPEYRVSLGLSRAARTRLEAFAPTLVHIATPDILGLRALRWARSHGIPVVATYHTHFASYLGYYRLGWAESTLWRYVRWFYAQCEHVYVPSRSMIDVLREKGVESDLRLWERGVETDRFHPRHRSMDWRRQHGIGDDEVVVAFVSRLVWEKGLDVYAEVVQQLVATSRAVRALVVGSGPAGDGLRERLPENAIFTGHAEGEELAQAYASSDVFLFPSETETFGNVTLEAMASGLPAVCADATGSKQLVAHGETGFLAPPRDADAFTEYTARLVDNAGLRATFGAAGRAAAEPYAWDAVLGRLLDYYHDALAPEPVPAA